MDYDIVADVYDRRYVQGGPVGVAESLRQVVRRVGARTALEVGCGTGHWLGGLKVAWACGADLSMEMLRKAQRKTTGRPLIRADAHHLPFRSHTFDLVYCINALHHFRDPSRFIARALGLLKPGGAVAVVGMDPRAGRDRWYLYDYFFGTREADLRRYPSTTEIESWMQAAGYARTQHRIAARITGRRIGARIFEDPVLHKHGTSQLTLLGNAEFSAGMDRIRLAFERDPGRVFLTEVLLYLTVGHAGN